MSEREAVEVSGRLTCVEMRQETRQDYATYCTKDHTCVAYEVTVLRFTIEVRSVPGLLRRMLRQVDTYAYLWLPAFFRAHVTIEEEPHA